MSTTPLDDYRQKAHEALDAYFDNGGPADFVIMARYDAVRNNMMTGQEWYERFKAELGEPQVFVGYGYDSVGYDEDAVLDAARLASGINDKET